MRCAIWFTGVFTFFKLYKWYQIAQRITYSFKLKIIQQPLRIFPGAWSLIPDSLFFLLYPVLAVIYPLKMKLGWSHCKLVLIPNKIKYLWLRYSLSCKPPNIYQNTLSGKIYPSTAIYLLKVNNKLTINSISHLVLVFLLLTLNV